jgi:hypothetical protein
VDVASLVQSTIVNKGEIVSDVDLAFYAVSSNSYDGRGGTVSGTITGGSSADTIRLGNDGETVDGGLDQI